MRQYRQVTLKELFESVHCLIDVLWHIVHLVVPSAGDLQNGLRSRCQAGESARISASLR